MKKESDGFDPRIVIFACNWCFYTGADTAAVSRMQRGQQHEISQMHE